MRRKIYCTNCTLCIVRKVIACIYKSFLALPIGGTYWEIPLLRTVHNVCLINLYNDIWPFDLHPYFQTFYYHVLFINDFVHYITIDRVNILFQVLKITDVYWHTCLSLEITTQRAMQNKCKRSKIVLIGQSANCLKMK